MDRSEAHRSPDSVASWYIDHHSIRVGRPWRHRWLMKTFWRVNIAAGPLLGAMDIVGESLLKIAVKSATTHNRQYVRLKRNAFVLRVMAEGLSTT